MTAPQPGRPLGFKAYVVGVLIFNVLLVLVMYLVATVFQWGVQ